MPYGGTTDALRLWIKYADTAYGWESYYDFQVYFINPCDSPVSLIATTQPDPFPNPYLYTLDTPVLKFEPIAFVSDPPECIQFI